MKTRIGIVAGEASGDLLGAALIRAYRERCPEVGFEGIGGPLMAAAGCKILYPAEKLSLLGLVEVLRHLPRVLSIRTSLARHFIRHPPDAFIGIDAPDFNLTLEKKLRKRGIRTAHYVSPSVWAWRRYRLHKIARAVDLMLTLFPFEAAFYRQHGIPVRFVGHPLADEIPLYSDREAARARVGLAAGEPVIALMPGSRRSELDYHARLFIDTAVWCQQRYPGLRFVAAFTDAGKRAQFEAALAAAPQAPPVTLVDRQAQDVMAAADVVLLASGTVALEAMLLKRPMVVAYRMAPLTYRVLKQMLTIETVSPPNLLAGETLVPEFIQDAATPAHLGAALLHYLDDQEATGILVERFNQLHQTIRCKSSEYAAREIAGLIHGSTAGKSGDRALTGSQ